MPWWLYICNNALVLWPRPLFGLSMPAGAASLDIAADFVSAAVFYSVPIILFYFVRRRRDVPFLTALKLFSAFFIVCGTEHLFAALEFWFHVLWFTGWLKSAVAILSVLGVAVLARMLPVLRRLNDQLEYRVHARTADLSTANQKLESEIYHRKAAEAEVHRLNENLQRRISELQTIFDILPVGIGVADDASCMEVRSNRLFAQMMNLQQRPADSMSASPVPLPPVRVFQHGRELTPEEYPMQRAVRENEPLLNFEATIQREDGRELHLVVNAIPLRDQGGNVSGCVATLQDVTAQKLATHERLAFERRLQETQKLESLGVLAGGIAHDFNNLLTGIIGNASLARFELEEDPAAVRTALDNLEQAAMRAADLCKQMLAYAGKGRFVVQPLSLTRLVKETAHLLEVSIGKRASLQFQLAADLPTFHGDAIQMRQILVNLVTNAAEAIGERGGVIGVRTSVLYANNEYLEGLAYSDQISPGHYLCLEVTDNGPGMDKATLARVFDPFFTTKFTGRGLGLAAVLGIVRGHKGAVKVRSEMNRGTSFKLLFPVDPVETDSPPPFTLSELPAKRSGKVLLVDDEEAVRTVIERILKSADYDVVIAEDGVQAVEIVRSGERDFDVVLLDLTMPNMDGEEAFRVMRETNPHLHILIMSGYSENETARRFAGEGALGFLGKPFTRAGLLEKIAAVVAASSSQDTSLR